MRVLSLMPVALVLVLMSQSILSLGIERSPAVEAPLSVCFDNSPLVVEEVPIQINSDVELSDEASERGWRGKGTVDDPYIISNITLDVRGKNRGVFIGNTTSHILVLNCSITGVRDEEQYKGAGLWLVNVSHVTVRNCTVFGNYNGIFVEDSNNVTLTLSTIRNNTRIGISFGGRDISISNNSISGNPEAGITSIASRRCTISGNLVSGSGSGFGVILYVKVSEMEISNNTVFRNSGGICVRGDIDLENGTCAMISKNTVVNNSGMGIYSTYAERVFIDGNIVSGNDKGIVTDIMGSVTSNTVSNSTSVGISGGEKTRIILNRVFGVGGPGISIFGRYHEVLYNVITNCSGSGIRAMAGSSNVDFNVISTCGGNGIYVESRNVSLSGNLMTGCRGCGLSLSGIGHHTDGNVISENGGPGIHLISGNDIVLEADHVFENRGKGLSVVDASNLTLRRVDLHDNDGTGIHVVNASRVEFDNVSSSFNTGSGIIVGNGTDVTFRGCRIFSSGNGIMVGTGGDLNIFGCFFFDLEAGLVITRASSLEMSRNMFQGCGVYISSENLSFLESARVDGTNLVNGRKLYLVNSSYPDDSIPVDAGQVIVFGRSGIMMEGLNLSHSTVGLMNAGGNNITVRNSSFDRNLVGVHFSDVGGFRIRGCSFVRTGIGMETTDSRNGLVERCSFREGEGPSLILGNATRNVEVRRNLFLGSVGITSYAVWAGGENNVIWNNQFVYNRGTRDENVEYLHQSYDEGNNTWYLNGTGNYWRDLHCPDIDGDGLVEAVYAIEGPEMRWDPYPLSRSPLFEPPSLRVQPLSDSGSVLLSWEKPDLEGWAELRGYGIYRIVNFSDPELIFIPGGDSTSYLDDEVEPGVTYGYSIFANNSLVTGDRSTYISVMLDTFPPDVQVISPGDGVVIGSDTVLVEWVGFDNESDIDHYELRLDFGEWLSKGLLTEHRFFDLGEGMHTIELRATDTAGHIGLAESRFIVDMSPPALSIIEPVEGQLLSSNWTEVRWNALDDISAVDHIEYDLDERGPVPATAAGSVMLTGLSEGPHEVEVTAYDLASNSVSLRVGFIVDTVSPVVEVTSPAEGEILGVSDVIVSWNGYDTGTGMFGYRFRLDDQGWIDVGLSLERRLYQLDDGPHVVRIAAVDLAGNTNESRLRFMIDAQPPVVVITYPADGSHVSVSPVTVIWTVEDDISGISGVYFRKGDDDYVKVASDRYIMSGLGEGRHTIYLKVEDGAGNRKVVSSTFTVDRTPPGVLGFGPVGEDEDIDTTIFAYFSERMAPSSLVLELEGVQGNVVWKGGRVVFEPAAPLEPGRVYNVSLRGQDLAGNPLTPVTWSFRTTTMGRIKGRAVDERGVPVPDAELIMGDARASSRPDGSFFMEAGEGIHELKVKKGGYKTASLEVNVTAGMLIDIGTVHMEREDDRGVNLLAILLVPAAILMMVLIAAVMGSLITRYTMNPEQEEE